MSDVRVRFPGEPKDGRSKQAQSWVDAGDQLRNWWTSLQEATKGLNAGARTQGQVRPPTSDPMESFKYGNQFQDPLEAFKYGQPGDPRADSAALRGSRSTPFSERIGRPSPQDIVLGTGANALNDPLGLGGALGNLGPLLQDSWQNMLYGAGTMFRNQPPGGAAAGAPAASGALDALIDQAPQQGRTIDELIALASQYGAQRPNYDAVRQQLIGNTEQINNQIAAMYRRLGEDAQQNIQQIQDVYGGATSGIGAAYDTGTANIQDAYSSAQRQAAEQMARLGIEAAAPAVIDPMALSQAESVAGLEAGRAAGLSAAERYGATSGGFASQMGQVAQQEGVGYNQNLLAALQGQLGNLSMREAEANAQFNPMESALQYLQLEQAMNPPAQGPDLDFEFKRDQANISNYYRVYSDLMKQKVGLPPEELHQQVRDYILTGAMGEDMRQWVLQGNDPMSNPMAGPMSAPMSAPMTASSAPTTSVSTSPRGGIPFISNIGAQFSNIFQR